jgi:hypothetical protein
MEALYSSEMWVNFYEVHSTSHKMVTAVRISNPPRIYLLEGYLKYGEYYYGSGNEIVLNDIL